MFAKPFPAEKLGRVGADGYVSAEDVLFLRRMVFKDGIVSPEELDALFSLGEKAPKGDPEWFQFFEEAAADFYLREEEPQGYFTPAEFTTFKARVLHEGGRASALELRLMVKLFEDAVETPTEMRGFFVNEFRAAVAARGADARLTAEDAALLRRFVFAKGGDGNLNVARDEAEFLFDLNDATNGVGNDPAWTEFFVKAIAAHLMADLGYNPLSREEAKRLHDFASDHSVNVGGVFSRMVSGGLSGLFSKREKSVSAQRAEARDAAVAAAEVVTGSEADWLADRIGKDGSFSDVERRIIAHMRELGADLPPKLKALVERAA